MVGRDCVVPDRVVGPGDLRFGWHLDGTSNCRDSSTVPSTQSRVGPLSPSRKTFLSTDSCSQILANLQRVLCSPNPLLSTTDYFPYLPVPGRRQPFTKVLPLSCLSDRSLLRPTPLSTDPDSVGPGMILNTGVYTSVRLQDSQI